MNHPVSESLYSVNAYKLALFSVIQNTCKGDERNSETCMILKDLLRSIENTGNKCNSFTPKVGSTFSP